MKDTLVIFLIIICISCKGKEHSPNNSPIVEDVTKEITVPKTTIESPTEIEKVIPSDEVVNEEKKSLEKEIKKKSNSSKKIKPQPESLDLTKAKPDYSDPKTTRNPSAPSKKAKEEELKTEVAFRRNFYSFGEIMEGDTVDFHFSFTNIGEHPLLIKSATATCGCTHPSFSFLPVAPGEKGEITGMYVSTGKKGPQNPMVQVVANTFPTETHKLYLDGVVLETSRVKEDSIRIE